MSVEYNAVRRLQFCAGHRVLHHEGKCAHLHGHNYVVFIHARPTEDLDLIGRVIDFGVLKEAFGSWIEKHWDHGMILYDRDPVADLYQETDFGDAHLLSGMKFFLMPGNPTAENLAHFLLALAPTLVPPDIDVWKIVVWETENCFATAEVTS